MSNTRLFLLLDRITKNSMKQSMRLTLAALALASLCVFSSFASANDATQEEDGRLPVAGPDGQCGADAGKRCPDDLCCSPYHHCGSGEPYCGSGCQTVYGDCTHEGLPVAAVGEHCGAGLAVCAEGVCCSADGRCGAEDAHCREGCQLKFGDCPYAGLPVAGPHGHCGEGVATCPPDHCCSPHNYCGQGPAYCGIGCQEEYGGCSPEDLPVAPSGGECGSGHALCPENECCSSMYECGNTHAHCGTGCQPKYGDCIGIDFCPDSNKQCHLSETAEA